jgi:hypothetical protein
MRVRVSSLTNGLPRNARETVGCETPAKKAISKEVGLPFIFMPTTLTLSLSTLHVSGIWRANITFSTSSLFG